MDNRGAGLNRNSFQFQYFPFFFCQKNKTVQHCRLKVHQFHSIHPELNPTDIITLQSK